MNCKSILVVEDDEEIQKSVTKALSSEGYRILVADNGKVALRLLEQLSPEELPGCMILDLMMPEMDGITLLETIERDHKAEYGNIKVIVATAIGTPINTELIPHIVERIQKPFELDELFKVVEIHCGKPD